MNEQKKPLVCIVDDDAVQAKLMAFMLHGECETCVATSGLEAMSLIAERQPDLIMLDILMPGMDGLDVCEQLKSSASTRDIPIVFVTGLESHGDHQNGLEAGAVDYITKPLNAKVVRARIRRLLQSQKYLSLLEDLLQIENPTVEVLRDRLSSVVGELRAA